MSINLGLSEEEKLKAYKKQWYLKNKENILAKAKKEYEKNKESKKEYSKEYYKNNKTKVNEANKKWALNNKDKTKQYVKNSIIKNKDKYAETSKKWREANKEKHSIQKLEWRKNNKDKVNYHLSKRRSLQLNATPLWLNEFDEFVIAEAFDLSFKRAKLHNIQWHVDHIIPLRAKEACGLHCANNIQVIPQRLNNIKSNKMIFTNPFEWIKGI